MGLSTITTPEYLNQEEIFPLWYATYTAPRHEKSVAQHLQSRSVDTFLPLYTSTRDWNGRKARVLLPLFPCYLFVRIRHCDRLRVLEAPGVIRMIGSHGQLTPLPEIEVEQIRTTLQARDAQPHPLLTVGRRVRVKAGPLRGLEGIIVREPRGLRIVVAIESIMRSFSVELQAGDLETASSPPIINTIVSGLPERSSSPVRLR